MRNIIIFLSVLSSQLGIQALNSCKAVLIVLVRMVSIIVESKHQIKLIWIFVKQDSRIETILCSLPWHNMVLCQNS